MGPVLIDIDGTQLTDEDRTLLNHPNVAGVILFTRNYQDREQLLRLTEEIRQCKTTPTLICVDQEGGRVQRFRDGFSAIPPAGAYRQHSNGKEIAQSAGWVMATELLAAGVDFSFAPVLDIGEQCAAIGNRAFGLTVEEVQQYAGAFISGMKSAGMPTTGKHFPGHGGVLIDSHLATPYDQRNDILETDMQVFQQLIENDQLDAIMPAHVIYPAYDPQPASGSSFWLKTILRNRLAFKGVIFSDDLNMKGADVMGSYAERGMQALASGCDVLLLCNNREGLKELLNNLPIQPANNKLAKLYIENKTAAVQQMATPKWKEAVQTITAL
ncbi:beta-N-acetylhexosaminidase [Thaumasiovibrio sp. DFM-14]|uniref:beta-N-acetylhexosaminidase n=1 Tax=Thaumasiovibrio sp. DFM-14 TaxID=3384792 RepID=UPI00399EFA57